MVVISYRLLWAEPTLSSPHWSRAPPVPGNFPQVPHQEMGQDDVMQDSALRIRENTREVGAVQGRAQLLQHQGLPQLSDGAPALPAAAEKKEHED